MTIKSGFFNSQSGDRKYDAEDMNNILSGVIKNGVLYSVGQNFLPFVRNGVLTIGSGKAWINGHWITNDANYSPSLPAGPTNGDSRWDVFYLEISELTRMGSIDYTVGTASSNPQKPNITTSSGVHRLPICYVYRKTGAQIQNADVINLVGTNACPYVTFSVQDGTGAQIEAILNRLDNLSRQSFGIYVGTDDPSTVASGLNVDDIYIHVQS